MKPTHALPSPSFLSDLLARALTARPEAIDTLELWLRRHRAIARSYDEPIMAAIAAGAGTDRLAWAFGSGYQCAGRKLVPSIGAERIGALCATETGGAHPKAIETRLAGGALYGTKAFVTFGMEAEVLLVIASEGRSEEKNLLRAVIVERDATGLTFERMTEIPFVPEISHATIHFDGARGTVLEGDGYLEYLKPFRTIEDTHVLAAALAHAMTLANAAHLKEEFFERALATLLALIEISRLPPLDAATHLALAGVQESVRGLVEQIDAAKVGGYWERDRALFSVAGKARAQRREAAWRTVKK
jgi:alkylation response protein AidB-like acyl-CoA dehydrogenase